MTTTTATAITTTTYYTTRWCNTNEWYIMYS